MNWKHGLKQKTTVKLEVQSWQCCCQKQMFWKWQTPYCIINIIGLEDRLGRRCSGRSGFRRTGSGNSYKAKVGIYETMVFMWTWFHSPGSSTQAGKFPTLLRDNSGEILFEDGKNENRQYFICQNNGGDYGKRQGMLFRWVLAYS